MSRSMTALVVFVSMSLSGVAWGDIKVEPRSERPQPRAASTARADVVVYHADLTGDGNGVKAKIGLPKKVLAKLAREAKVGAVLEPSNTHASAMPWWTTIVAGLALTVGAVVALFGVARDRRVVRTAATAALLLGALASGYAIANAPPPRVIDKLNAERPVAESVLIEIVDGDAVTITLQK